MLAKAHRIVAQRDFGAVMRHGTRCDNGYVRLFSSPNTLAVNRFGILVKNHVFRTAVQRNRWKRIVREIIGVRVAQSQRGHDTVILLYTSPRMDLTSAAWREPILALLRQAGILVYV